MLDLTVLGSTSALTKTREGEPGGEFRHGKPLALIAYLSAVPRREASRDELVDLLWADVEPDAGRHALRQTLWYIKRRLGDDVLGGDASRVVLECEVKSDRADFVAAVEAGDARKAVAAYTGDFLPKFNVPGGGEFERWAELERARLRSMFVRCSEAVIRDALRTANFKEAQQLARRLCEADPFHQGGRRLLLEALVCAHDTLGAASEADTLERFLIAEEIEPEPATRAAIATARTPVVAAADKGKTASGLVTQLVGREREFSTLVDRWAAARAGTHAHVHIVGAAGMGKSRLLTDFHARLRAKRSRTAWVRVHPGERHLPYSMAADLADALAHLPGASRLGAAAAATLVALNPALSSVFTAPPDATTGAEALRRRSLALADLARSVADDAPLALLIDDLHWADADSRQVLTGVMARLDGAPILLVTTARPVQDVLIPRSPTEVIQVEGLDVERVGELVESVGTLPDEPWAASLAPALHTATRGVPLLIIESLLLASDKGVLTVTDGKWSCRTPSALAEMLRAGSAIERRLRDLPRPEGWTLSLLSFAGMPLSESDLGALTHLDNSSAALALLEQRGVARRLGDRWIPSHDEIADAARRIATPEATRKAHIELGAYFAKSGARDARRSAVEHLLAAEQIGGVRQLFLDELKHVRRGGDRRSTSAICAEFLEANSSSDLVASVASSVPLRLRRRTRPLAWLGAFFVVAVAARWAMPTDVPEDPAQVIATLDPHDGDTTLDIRVGKLDAARWPVAQPIPMSGAHPDMGQNGVVVLSWDGSRFLSRDFPDSGEVDVVEIGKGGVERRVTHSEGDDYVAGLSPDGRFALLTTQRLDTISDRNDIAVLDRASGSVRMLTHSRDFLETTPAWSPDGSRIAWFARSFKIGSPSSVCVSTFDGEHIVCRPAGAEGITLGWRSPTEVAFARHYLAPDEHAHAAIATWNLMTDSITVIEPNACDGTFGIGFQSGWRLCNQISAGRITIAPAWEPARARRIGVEGRMRGAVIVAPPARTEWIGSVKIRSPRTALVLGSSARLSADAFDSTGRQIPFELPLWTSLDPGIAMVDPSGVVRPQAIGSARIVVSAGGWRSDTAVMTVSLRAAAVIRLEEHWQAESQQRWTFFGTPAPRIASAGATSTFSLEGDGHYFNGALSTLRLSGTPGVGVEAVVRMPVTQPNWQVLNVALIDARQVPTIGGFLPEWKSSQTLICTWGAPSREGADAIDSAVVGTASSLTTIAMSPGWRDGRPFRIRVQILEDGRCGIAINGRAVAISTNVLDQSVPYTIMLAGNAVGTKIHIDRVDAWSGVQSDVDWNAVDVLRKR